MIWGYPYLWKPSYTAITFWSGMNIQLCMGLHGYRMLLQGYKARCGKSVTTQNTSMAWIIMNIMILLWAKGDMTLLQYISLYHIRCEIWSDRYLKNPVVHHAHHAENPVVFPLFRSHNCGIPGPRRAVCPGLPRTLDVAGSLAVCLVTSGDAMGPFCHWNIVTGKKWSCWSLVFKNRAKENFWANMREN